MRTGGPKTSPPDRPRRRRDLNTRGTDWAPNRFRGGPVRPLRHASVAESSNGPSRRRPAWQDTSVIDVETGAGIRLFEGLPPDVPGGLAAWLAPVDDPADWHLLNQGACPDGFFVVL